MTLRATSLIPTKPPTPRPTRVIQEHVDRPAYQRSNPVPVLLEGHPLRVLGETVCECVGVPYDHFLSTRRNKRVTLARCTFTVMCRSLPTSYFGGMRPSYPAIANAFGSRGHVTALSHYQRHAENFDVLQLSLQVADKLKARGVL